MAVAKSDRDDDEERREGFSPSLQSPTFWMSVVSRRFYLSSFATLHHLSLNVISKFRQRGSLSAIWVLHVFLENNTASGVA